MTLANCEWAASGPIIQHIYLTHGWLPIAVQVTAAVTLVLSVVFRSRRWWLRWLPVAVIVGIAVVLLARWYMTSQGLAGEPAPPMLWGWIALSGFAAALVVVGWRGARWWMRGASVLAVPACVIAAALVVNVWTGYVLTVQGAWSTFTEGPLPNEADMATVRTMASQGEIPQQGKVVRVNTGSAGSNFQHRGELVYLPPIWFQPNPPKLPVIVMLGGAMTSSSDWLRRGEAAQTADAFAAAHGGSAPILVFPDLNGMFDKDTECVNGTRGNAADHLTKDVVPYVINEFGATRDSSNWGIVGWSMGGTCAVGLAVKYPEVFSAFVDIAGDLGPNIGNKQQTIDRLYGGNADAYDAFDPSTVIQRHDQYSDMSGWFVVPAEGDEDTVQRDHPGTPDWAYHPVDRGRCSQLAMCARP